ALGTLRLAGLEREVELLLAGLRARTGDRGRYAEEQPQADRNSDAHVASLLPHQRSQIAPPAGLVCIHDCHGSGLHLRTDLQIPGAAFSWISRRLDPCETEALSP